MTLREQVFKDPVLFFAFGFGAGLLPKAPGTFGTLVAVPMYLALASLNSGVYVAIVLILTAFGIWICGYSAKKLGVHDHQGIVWDEIAGYLITMVPVSISPVAIVAGFILFRIFDILKPWPIRTVDEQVVGGLGIMLDDVLAGVYASICLTLLMKYIF